MLEILRDYEQNMLAGVAQVGEPSSDTSYSSDGNLSLGSYDEEFVDEEGDGVNRKLIERDNVGDRDIIDDGHSGGAGCNFEQEDIDVGYEGDNVDVDVDAEQDDVDFGDEKDELADDEHGEINDEPYDVDGEQESVDVGKEQDDAAGYEWDDIDLGAEPDDERDDFAGGEQGDISDEQDNVGGEQENVDVDDERDVDDLSGDCKAASVADILREIKKESVFASSPTDLYDVLADLDGCIKKRQTRKVRETSKSYIDPLIDHLVDSFPSLVSDDTIKWILANCCRGGGVEVCVICLHERMWMVPDEWICVYGFWFIEYYLWFPLPKLLLAYCDAPLIVVFSIDA
ncbi:hypothetical protein N665_0149s0006 [Sinapis alba]|nr:hypothetical protein N665_0149s0006 [Sinapis alba]